MAPTTPSGTRTVRKRRRPPTAGSTSPQLRRASSANQDREAALQDRGGLGGQIKIKVHTARWSEGWARSSSRAAGSRVQSVSGPALPGGTPARIPRTSLTPCQTRRAPLPAACRTPAP